MAFETNAPCKQGDRIRATLLVNGRLKQSTGTVVAIIGGFGDDVLIVETDWDDGTRGPIFWPITKIEVIESQDDGPDDT